MNDLQLAIHILKEISEGKKFSDFDISYNPVVLDDIRYDKCTAGFFYMPWLHNQAFLDLYAMAEKIEGGSYQGMFVAPRAYVLLKAVESALSITDGDFVECGVYKGGTALLAAEVMLKDDAATPTLHLFDTFAGIPAPGLSGSEQGKGLASQYSDVSLEATKGNLDKYSDFLKFYPGLVPETFKDFAPRPIRYLHVDINTAKAHTDCLEFFVPQLVDGAVVLFDDYGWPGYAECKQAVDEFVTRNGLPAPISLMTGQALYVHRKGHKRLLDF